MVSALRAGRANGMPRPRLTDRGSRVPLSQRWISRPRPVCCALPALIASAADRPRARSAGTSADRATTTGTPTSAPTSTHRLMPRSPAPRFSKALVSSGRASRLPRTVPIRQPTIAGIDTIAR